MAHLAKPLILASASPRRKEILSQLGLTFSVYSSNVDEVLQRDEAPESYVSRLARDKAQAVARQVETDGWVLGADTTVCIDDLIFEKPVDDQDALRMIRRLSGCWHEVLTGFALCDSRSGEVHVRTVCTRVRFRELQIQACERYVQSGEGRDKAGAYAVQGLGAGLVRDIEGSYTNVVGLPAAQTIELLIQVGALTEWP